MTKKAHYPSKDVESFLLSIMESYEYKGYCTARMHDYKKCIHFEEHEVGQGICKHLLLGGSCNWEQDTMDMIVDIYDCKGEKE